MAELRPDDRLSTVSAEATKEEAAKRAHKQIRFASGPARGHRDS